MHIEKSIPVTIRRHPAEVFAHLIEISEWPRWGGGNLIRMEQVSPGPLQVGSQIRQINMAGKNIRDTLVEVTQLVQNQAFGIKRPDLKGAFTLEPAGTGTQLSAHFEVEATGPIALVYWLFLKQMVKTDLLKFKILVESG